MPIMDMTEASFFFYKSVRHCQRAEKSAPFFMENRVRAIEDVDVRSDQRQTRHL